MRREFGRFTAFIVPLVVLLSHGVANAAKPDLSKLADQTRWEWDDHAANLLSCMIDVRRRTPDYGITLTSDSPDCPWSIKIGVTRGSEVVYSWVGHPGTVFDVVGDTLYYVDVFTFAAVGGVVHAVNLQNGELLWKTRLKGMGGCDHSAYLNQLTMRASGTVLYFFGRESQGDYIEVVDAREGRTVSHRVVTKHGFDNASPK